MTGYRQTIYDQFTMDYAKAEDSIRAKWQQLVLIQDKCVVRPFISHALNCAHTINFW